MKITLEGTEEDVGVTTNEYQQFTIQINGEDRYFQIRDFIWDRKLNGLWERPSTDWSVVALEIKKLTVKTKEEIAAEESVAKAKEALKAAENALKVVKEKK